jgi:dTMP kinase
MSSPSPKKQRGAFIVFEGLDRSGKSTQSAQLLSRLRAAGIPCIDTVWSYPDRTSTVGRVLDHVLSSNRKKDGDPASSGGPALSPHALHLLFTANRWERSQKLHSLLMSGVTVVADRYAYSGVAYSVGAERLPVAWCKQVEVGLIAADVVVYLRIDAGEAAKRNGYGGERYEVVETQKDIQAVFEDEFVASSASGDKKSWKLVDGGNGRSVSEISDEIWNIVSPMLENLKGQPVRALWD